MSDPRDPTTWRLQTADGIPYRVLSRKGSFQREDASAEEAYLIQPGQLAAFVLECFPVPYAIGGTIFYPARWRLPGFPALSAQTINWEAFDRGRPVDPFGTDGGAGDRTYGDLLKVTVQYGTSGENDGGDDGGTDDPKAFLDIQADAAHEFLVHNASGKMKWQGQSGLFEDEDKEVEDPNTPLKIDAWMTEWTLRWPRVPTSFFEDTLRGRLQEHLEHANSEVMTVLYDAPAETILFESWSLGRQYTWRDGVIGTPPVEIEMKFVEKNFTSDRGVNGATVNVTHNHMFDQLGIDADEHRRPCWDRLVMGPDEKPIYEQSDLNKIFTG